MQIKFTLIAVFIYVTLSYSVSPLIAYAQDPVADKVDLLGHLGGETEAVFLDSRYAYIGEGPTLMMLAASNPAVLTVAGKAETLPTQIEGVFVSDDIAYVATGEAGLWLIDVTLPSQSFIIGYYDTPGFATDVVVADNLAYVADGFDGGLQIIDVSDPTSLEPLGNYNSDGTASSLTLVDELIFMADGFWG